VQSSNASLTDDGLEMASIEDVVVVMVVDSSQEVVVVVLVDCKGIGRGSACEQHTLDTVGVRRQHALWQLAGGPNTLSSLWTHIKTARHLLLRNRMRVQRLGEPATAIPSMHHARIHTRQ
jgi:hypothetical protein